MRKTVKFISAAMVMAMLTGCSGTPSEIEDPYDKGMELIALMTEMAGNENYLEAFAYGEVKDEISASITSDYSSPSAVYEIRFDDSFALQLLGMENFDSISGELKNNLTAKSCSNFSSQLNAAAGVNALTASAILTASDSFYNPDFSGNAVYLYMYEGSAPAAVAFSEGGSGAVSASASFILYKDFRPENKDQVEAFFEDYPVEVKEIEG